MVRGGSGRGWVHPACSGALVSCMRCHSLLWACRGSCRQAAVTHIPDPAVGEVIQRDGVGAIGREVVWVGACMMWACSRQAARHYNPSTHPQAA
jgi:hypothetical protein